MQCENNYINNFAETFAKMIVIINPMNMAHFFEETCSSILKHLLTICSKNIGLLGLISTYFDTIKPKD